jgi:4-hydroxybutyrate CoA-transferase
VKQSHPDKIVSPDEAVKSIKSGSRVLLEGSLSEPVSLINALINQRKAFESLEIITASPIRAMKLADESMSSHFRLNTFFARGGAGEIIKKGRADYFPSSLFGVTKALEEKILPIDVALVQLSPTDDAGNCNFGINVSYIKPAVESAKMVIAEFNDQMPRVRGDSSISVDKIDLICETSRPLPTIDPSPVDENVTEIARLVASLIPSGATIEVGIGAIPASIMKELHDKEDIGIHSGMISDPMMDLVKKGIITNKNKPFDRDKSVVSMAMGSQTLYDWVNENPHVMFYPSSYTHSIHIISQINDFIAVNSGLQVDLTGQVNAEMLDGLLVSGVGGGADFARGASASKRGFSIIALHSTGGRDQVSRIVTQLPEGSPVTYHRSDVDFLVTEYGIADLRCTSLNKRANRIIRIAHPNHRDRLAEHLNVSRPSGF